MAPTGIWFRQAGLQGEFSPEAAGPYASDPTDVLEIWA